MAAIYRCCGKFCRDFQAFALRDAIIDLAVGIVLGTAFVTVIESLVNDIITPPLGLVLGGTDFGNLTFKMKNFVYKDQPAVVIRYGKFIQTVLTLFIITLVLFFALKGVTRLSKIGTRKKQNEPLIELEVPDQVKILCEIRDLLAKQSVSSSPLSTSA